MNKIKNMTHKIFYDNKALVVFSFIMAVIIWLVVAIALSPTDTAVIKDVPVAISLDNSVPAQFNLQIFGQSDFTVDVRITGKRYIVNSLSIGKNSVKVIAQTAYVDSAGKHSLNLKVSKANENDEFEIESLSEDYIEVYFDAYMEKDFPLEAKVNTKQELVDEGYLSGEPVLSANTITVSGPATEVNSVSKVCAELDVEKPLIQTRTDAAQINAYNENGGTLHYLSYNYGNSDITLTIPVYLVVNKPTEIAFKNSPAAYIQSPLPYTINPSQLEAGVQGITDESGIDKISITSVDFADLKPGVNKFSVDAQSISSILVDSSIKTFEVTVTADKFKTRQLTVPDENISYINAPEGYEVNSLAKSVGSVTIVGPENSLSGISAADIFAVIDLTDVDTTKKTQEFSAKLSIKNVDNCWVYGRYTVKIKN